MQSVNPHDQQSAQVQSVDHLVSEIRQIADHIYQEGVQELSQPPTSAPRSHNSPQKQLVQPAQDSGASLPERADLSTRRPPLNPGEISKGLSKLHARVDEVLRRTPQRKMDDSGIYDSLGRAANTRNSFVGDTAGGVQYRIPTDPYSLNQPASNYSSIQRSTTTTTTMTRPPLGVPGMHGPSASISTSTLHQPQDLIFNNPFSDNALSRTGEYDSRKPVVSYGASLASHLSPGATVHVAPWSTNTDLVKTQREDVHRPFKSPSTFESGINQGIPTEILGYHPGLREVRVDHNAGYPDPRMSAMSSSHVDTRPGNQVYQSASVPAFKPRYDKSKLDSIISSIRTRDGGNTSVYESHASIPVNPMIHSRIQEPPVQHNPINAVKQPTFFAGEPHHARPVNYESVPRDYHSPARGLPPTHNVQQYNPMVNSRFVSPPGQFSSPQNVIPSSNVYPSNPFNQPRHETDQEAIDYYGFHQQPQREYQVRNPYGYPEEQPHMTPQQSYGRVVHPESGYQQQHYTPEYDTRYPQQQRYREPERHDPYGYEEPVYDPYERDDRYNSNRREVLDRRMGPSDIKRGLNKGGNRRGQPQEYVNDNGLEFENDDDSLIEDRQPVRRRGNQQSARKQENPNPNLFGGLEDDESFGSDQDSFIEQTKPKLRPGRRGASRPRAAKESQDFSRNQEPALSDRKHIPKPTNAVPRQELVRNAEPVRNYDRPATGAGATRRGTSARGRRAELGGGDLVYNPNREDTANTSVQRKQPVGHEQGRGGSVPRRAAKDRDAVNEREFVAKDKSSLRNSRAPQTQNSERDYESRNGGYNPGYRGSANPQDYLNDEEELSDFDFDSNADRGRGKASQPAARDEDSVTRAFEQARSGNSGRKMPTYASGRDGVSRKTEMPGAGNGRRKVYR